MSGPAPDKPVTVRAVLFDLDGTLADTAPDLAACLNQVLEEEGRPVLPYERIRPVASHGGLALIRLGFGIGEEAPEFDRIRTRFLGLYERHIARETRPFAGMEELFAALAALDIPWGVVTNKPEWLTTPLMAALGLDRHAACVVSGDTTPERKPHPGPLLFACDQIGIPPAECLYVGDAERDIEAGRRAGMRTLVAGYGYIEEHERPDEWGGDGIIETPMEVLQWLA